MLERATRPPPRVLRVGNLRGAALPLATGLTHERPLTGKRAINSRGGRWEPSFPWGGACPRRCCLAVPVCIARPPHKRELPACPRVVLRAGPPKPRPEAVLRELQHRVKDLERRERQLHAEVADLHRERHEVIRDAVEAGLPMTAAGEALGISRQRIGQIVRGQ